ncbi:hypothetical protein CSV61_15535 [Sporosarcina sp. P3]|uniref:FAD-dependent oxidoreductase n=1 Tax=Sporosarcina sp. P3 TaxID=2048245 RepID=UPI000C16A0F3|nr:FAD-dependent oxidoreductase [Sporosarcina sp. P3]PID20291.1 hypothetical protein CSV61_15535 [Sporosarcina sp. P3]
MSRLEGSQQSFWKTEAGPVHYAKLSKDLEVDTAVIGGGISGALTAYLLAKAGRSVAIVEARDFSAGSTGGTTAKLSSQHQLIYHEMLQRDGLDVARKFYDANEEGRKLIESISKEHNIDCDFTEEDAYVFTQDGSHTESLKAEAQAYDEIGIDGGMTNSIPIDFDVSSALVMRKQAQFQPVKFIHGLLKAIEELGGKIIQHTRYMDKEEHDDYLVLTTNTPYKITCKQVVLATLFPVEDPHSFYSNTMEPMSSHLTAFESDQPFGTGVYIGQDEPRRTFRGAYDGDQPILIVGGNTHRTGNKSSTIDHYEAIRQFTKAEFGLTKMLAYWSEHDMVTPDRRPFIGPIEEGNDKMFVMTGYNKWGLAVAGTAAQLICDLIEGKENSYAEFLSPQRDLPKKEEKEDQPSILEQAKQLSKGEAKRFEINEEASGMYRDHTGDIHYVNLTCTHLGCEVKWNDGDETWDCPCHGSIFDGTGKVIAGPAKDPLKQIDVS